VQDRLEGFRYFANALQASIELFHIGEDVLASNQFADAWDCCTYAATLAPTVLRCTSTATIMIPWQNDNENKNDAGTLFCTDVIWRNDIVWEALSKRFTCLMRSYFYTCFIFWWGNTIETCLIVLHKTNLLNVVCQASIIS